MYQVYKNGCAVGAPFGQRQDADDYAKSIGGTVGPAEATQSQKPEQQKLTQ
jgi:hypothetical protein